jgi:glutathione peroxidase-family protein
MGGASSPFYDAMVTEPSVQVARASGGPGHGGAKDLRDHAGQLFLIVNVASKCGLTPQYEGPEALNRDAGDRGLQVVGFPIGRDGSVIRRYEPNVTPEQIRVDLETLLDL